MCEFYKKGIRKMLLQTFTTKKKVGGEKDDIVTGERQRTYGNDKIK